MIGATVYARSKYPPYERIACFDTAFAIGSAWEIRASPGKGSFSVAASEAQSNFRTLSLGCRCEIVWPGYLSWYGMMQEISEDQDGVVTVGCLDMLEALNGRENPQDAFYPGSKGSGFIFRDVLIKNNAVNATGVIPPSLVPVGPAVRDFEIGGRTGLDALQDLQEETGFEAWLEHSASASRLECFGRWTLQQGKDNSARVHLWEGANFSQFAYRLDQGAQREAVSAIGGTVAVRDRSRVQIKPDERQKRAGLRLRAPAFGRVLIEPNATTLANLFGRAGRELERTLSAAESFDIAVIDGSLPPLFNKLMAAGDYITLHARTEIGGDIARIVRINAVEKSTEGETILSVEVSLR